MDFDDFIEPEIAVTAAVTAAVFSRRGRQILRRGAVYGMAGALVARDAVVSFARGVSQGLRQVGTVVTEKPGYTEGTSQGQGR
jgi:hypothetical protein